MSPATDSAGQPFEGRAFQQNPHAGDSGECDPQLAEALEGLAQSSAEGALGTDAVGAVMGALAQARVLIPLVAEAGELGATDSGAVVEKSQELAVVHVEAPDGRAVSPIFSDVEALTRWNAQARPIPVPARQAAVAAAKDGLALMVLNPGSLQTLALRRGAIKALATGEHYVPAWEDPLVLSELRSAFAADDTWAEIESLRPGDPRFVLEGPEVIVTLRVAPGMDSHTLHERLAGATQVWGDNPVLAERVDGFGVKVVSA